MSKVKKTLSLLLALALVFSLFPASVFAEGEEDPDIVEACTGGEDCAAETHNEGCAMYVPPVVSCTGGEDCAAQTHNEGCPKYVPPVVSYTGGEDCAAQTHNEGCPKYVPPLVSCTGGEDCAAQTHSEGCAKYIAPVVSCTGGEDCAAETHSESCAKYIAPVVNCTKTEGCTLPDGHDGSCNAAPAAPAHDCEGQLEQTELDEGEMGWRCPVCGALFDAKGNELPATSILIDDYFNGSPAQVDANGNLLLNETNFPDANFRSYIINQFDEDGLGYLTETQVAAIKSIFCAEKQIANLKGIQYFTALTDLLCQQNGLSALDVSKNKALKQLHCEKNQLTALDISNNTQLTLLNCSNNQLSSLDVSKNTQLTHLDCGDNSLTALGVNNNTQLTRLDCSGNKLTELELSANVQLKELYCNNNQLSRLDVSKNTALDWLACGFNQLETLDVSNNSALVYLGCYNNQLTGLDLGNTPALTYLRCSDNRLTALALFWNTQLKELYCNNNRLTKLELYMNTQLVDVRCNNNQLTSLIVSESPDLALLYCDNNQLTSLDVSKNSALFRLHCNNNKLTRLELGSNAALKEINLSAQTSSAETYWQNDQLQLNLGTVVGTENLSRVSNVTGGSYDSSTGIVTLPAPESGATTVEVGYEYNTNAVVSPNALSVTVTVSVLDGTFNGSPAQVDANGNLLLNEANFPDANFLSYIKDTFDNGNQGYLTNEQVTDVTEINCSGKELVRLKGIEYFTSLTTLNCSSNQLTSLDLSSNTALSILNCSMNGLKTLDVSANTALKELSCAITGLTSLDLSQNPALEVLGCAYNHLASLDLSKNTKLSELYCESNQLTSLDLSKNTKLTSLYCSHNQLTSLDVSGNTALATLYCGVNQLISLRLGSNTALTELQCSSNQLTSLDVSKNTALTVLNCSSNQLTSLDVSKNTGLTWLYCDGNQLTSLDLSKNTTLTSLSCEAQTALAECTAQDGKLLLDLGSIVGAGNLSRVSNVTGGSYDASTGIVTLDGTGSEVTYEYITSTTASAKTMQVTLMTDIGICGDNLTWKLDDAGLLTISGTGEMYDFDPSFLPTASPWAGNSLIKSIRIEQGVTSIGKYAFQSCAVSSISLPDTLTTIGANALFDCNKLTSVSIPAGVTRIDLDAFVCLSLQQINVAQDNAAYASVDGVLFDKAMTTIVCYPAGRSGPYTVPEGVTTLYHSFFECRQLTSVVLPSSLKEIGAGAFYRCTSLESIIIPGSVDSIGNRAFSLCNGLDELTFQHGAADNLSIGTYAFYVENPTTTTIKVPDAENIHSALNGYDWAGDNRTVTYVMDNSNHLDLTNNTDLAGHTEVWIDGVAYPIETDGGRYVNLPETGTVLTTFSFKQGTSAGSHDNYPTGMEVYRIVRTENGATVEKVPELSDLLIYSGCSIRITGKPGIRMITSMTQQAKAALTGAGLADYTLEEYGTVIAWKDDLGGEALTLANGKSNYAYRRGVADPVFANVGELTQYTNVLVWDSLEDAQYAQDIAMRPYIILSKDGETVTLYGGTVERSIGYVAQQNADTFPVGSAGYKYVHDIIDKVNGLTGGNG